MTLDASIVVPGIFATAYGLFWVLVRAASIASREEERRPMYRHVCTRCGRVQLWTEQFDQYSPCPACQRMQPGMVAAEQKPEEVKKRPYDDQKQGSFIPGRRMVELDLDNMTPDQIREALIEGEQTCRISARS